MIAFDQLTWLHGKPQSSGLLKANPEDFLVVEDLGFAPDGEGEHVLVRILKNGCNTRFVADALAKFLKIHAREVSFAGQKDKHAVTEQWLCHHQDMVRRRVKGPPRDCQDKSPHT